MSETVREFRKRLALVKQGNDLIKQAVVSLDQLSQLIQVWSSKDGPNSSQSCAIQPQEIHLCVGAYGRAKKAINTQCWREASQQLHNALALHDHILGKWPFSRAADGVNVPLENEVYLSCADIKFRIEDWRQDGWPSLAVQHTATMTVQPV